MKRFFLFYKNFFLIIKLKIFNYRFFNKKIKNSKSQVLVEFNPFHSSHCLMSLISNYLVKKHNSRLVAFNNNKLTSVNYENSLLNKIKWFLGKNFKFRFFGVYSSFGVSYFIEPSLKKKNYIEVNNIYNNIIKNLKTNFDIDKIKIDNILFGDLIYDGYLKLYSEVTIDLKSKNFQDYLYRFIMIYIYWKNYLKKNNVKSVIGVHSLYAYGIIHRLAIFQNIESFIVIQGRVFRLNRDYTYEFSDYKNSKFMFSKFNNFEKEKFLNISSKSIEIRLKGYVAEKINELTSTKSAFSKSYDPNINVLNKNKKLKILIATHSVGDACNAYGVNFFPDFKKWLEYLSNLSKETDFEWYIKDHPYYSDLKLARSLDRTTELTKQIVNNNKKIIHLDSDVSHHQIIGEKINFVLTVYGTIAFEYAYLGIPVIVATKNCPTSKYSFNILPKDLKDYENILRNLDKIDHKINKNEVLEYYFMRYIYHNYNHYFEDFGDFVKKNSFDHYDNFRFYNYWVNNLNIQKINNITTVFDKFYNSNEHSLNISHNEKLFNNLLNERN
tara:strand:- start:4188 stop:5846 length:1659 start_codon:yes stop_codon:yes gene_type:complete